MTSILARRPAYVRLGAAALLAGATLAGTSGTLGDPATACAAPPRSNSELYAECVRAANDRAASDPDEVRRETRFWREIRECCDFYGGTWKDWEEGTRGEGQCDFPAGDAPAELPRFPDLGEATATLTPAPPPPPGPMAPLPPVEATLAPPG